MTRWRLEYASRHFRRLEEIREYIAEHNPEAAIRVLDRIRTAVDRLAAAPGLGRPGRVPGTRELIVSGTAYIVPYRAKDGVVQVITVLHGAQRWPARFP